MEGRHYPLGKRYETIPGSLGPGGLASGAVQATALVTFVCLSLCHQCGQDLKSKHFSLQPSAAEMLALLGLQPHHREMAGHVVRGRVAAFPQHRHLGHKPSIRPLGTA